MVQRMCEKNSHDTPKFSSALVSHGDAFSALKLVGLEIKGLGWFWAQSLVPVKEGMSPC